MLIILFLISLGWTLMRFLKIFIWFTSLQLSKINRSINALLITCCMIIFEFILILIDYIKISLYAIYPFKSKRVDFRPNSKIGVFKVFFERFICISIILIINCIHDAQANKLCNHIFLAHRKGPCKIHLQKNLAKSNS